MTYKQALKKAASRAKKTGNDYYIFDESDQFGKRFDIGNDFDADTFFAGSACVAMVDPDGNIER